MKKEYIVVIYDSNNNKVGELPPFTNLIEAELVADISMPDEYTEVVEREVEED